ncbi:inositol monophosphatase family protein [Chitinophaga sp. Cy-1792]|uniref:inositol monophosphatase family protein n=1 Tax=Chitinophaga sp. Cy-1792 TaxID=2608339 RepID=UPI00141D92D3|nr:inositol monophosphatase family protein [Chitinophaga sp. Cy-1792]
MKRLQQIAGNIESAVNTILGNNLVHWIKADATPVTNMDIAIQAAIIRIIREHYPNDNIISEEEGGYHISAGEQYSWVIDPIDGTANFIEQKKEFGISVGLMEDNRFVEALLVFPALQEKYYAAAGAGIVLNGQPFRPAPPDMSQIAKEVILCSKTMHSLTPFFSTEGYNTTCYRCATYSLLMLLKGRAVMYHTINTRLYDVGPMSFIVSEAGIKSFDSNRRALAFSVSEDVIPFFLSTVYEQLPEKIYEIMMMPTV